MRKLRDYKVTANSVEHLLTQVIKAKSATEAKDIFFMRWNKGKIPVVLTKLYFKEVNYAL